MPHLKTFLCGSLLSLAMAFTAHAQTKINISGSTAYRGATHTAIQNILGAGYTYAYTGGSLSGASQAIFKGSVGSNPVVIKTSWTGSVAGVQSLTRNLNANFLADSINGSTQGDGSTNPGTTSEGVDVAMSDTFQNSTPFPTPLLTTQKVGVVPFKWMANADAPLGLNMTPQLAQFLFGNGSMALSLMTGQSTDRLRKLFAIGRDADSGTRLTAFAESGVGVNSVVVQYQPTVTGSEVTSHIPWPATPVNGIPHVEGDGGYNSGGTLAGIMTKTTLANLNGFYVTYLSLSDAQTALNGGAKEMTYNGVPYSLTALQEGLYTFWSYEHLLYRSTTTGVQKTVADKLADQILQTDATVRISTMKVDRQTDGGQVRQAF